MRKRFYVNAVKAKAYRDKLLDNLGGDYIEMLVKILIAVVVGSLLLAGLTALFNTLWPEMTQKIFDMFGIGGSSSSSLAS